MRFFFVLFWASSARAFAAVLWQWWFSSVSTCGDTCHHVRLQWLSEQYRFRRWPAWLPQTHKIIESIWQKFHRFPTCSGQQVDESTSRPLSKTCSYLVRELHLSVWEIEREGGRGRRRGRGNERIWVGERERDVNRESRELEASFSRWRLSALIRHL